MNEEKSTSKEPKHDVELTQLSQLNTRARTYSTKFWQIPYAYIGLTGLALFNVSDKCSSYLEIVLWGSFILGVLTIFGMCRMIKSLHRSVSGIQLLEARLLDKELREINGEKITGKDCWFLGSQLLMVIVPILFYAYLLCRGVK